MPAADDFSISLASLFTGAYDGVDCISLRSYLPRGQTSGGLLMWRNQFYPNTPPTQQRLRQFSVDLGCRVQAYARKEWQ